MKSNRDADNNRKACQVRHAFCLVGGTDFYAIAFYAVVLVASCRRERMKIAPRQQKPASRR